MAGSRSAPVSADVLDRLSKTIAERRHADPDKSYTARLFQRGIPKIAQKVGEEAVEALIEGVRGKPARLVSESADLLYHLLVLWEAAGVKPGAVWKELARREQGVAADDEPQS
jgi:phosphoribosyl-ATP pyrophosphohydrolase